MTRPQAQQAIAKFILDCEARRDKAGHLSVYTLPRGDGGGTFEVAGINDRYDHDIAYELRRLIKARQFAQAEAEALDYYLENTKGVLSWMIETPSTQAAYAIEASLRDAAFNRGLRGSAKILQRALGFTGNDVDGRVGPNTRAALTRAIEHDPKGLLLALRAQAEAYERIIAPPVGNRAKFWQGLLNRWDKRLAFSLGILDPARKGAMD